MWRALLLSMLIPVSAPALTLYRCELDGQVLYSDRSCPGGNVVDVREKARNNPPRSAASVKRQIDSARKKASGLEIERRVREDREQLEQQQIAAADLMKEQKCVALALRKRWAEEDAAIAAGYSPVMTSNVVLAEKTKALAQRVAERHEAECGR